MISTRRFLLTGFTALALLPGCAAVKMAGVAAEGARMVGVAAEGAGAVARAGEATVVVGKAASGVTKAGAVARGARVAAETVALERGGAVAVELVEVGEAGEAAWRLGSKADDASVFQRVRESPLTEAASHSLDAATQCADFRDWVNDSEPEEKGHSAGEGAPRAVADVFLETTYPATPLGKAKLIKKRYWMQFYRMEQGDRLVVYDLQRKSIKIVTPGS